MPENAIKKDKKCVSPNLKEIVKFYMAINGITP